MLIIINNNNRLKGSIKEFIAFIQYLTLINVKYEGNALWIPDCSIIESNNNYINSLHNYKVVHNTDTIVYNLHLKTIPYVEEFNRLYNDYMD